MVRGSGFTDSLQVRFGTAFSPSVNVLGGTEAEVMVPPSATGGVGDVVVTVLLDEEELPGSATFTTPVSGSAT